MGTEVKEVDGVRVLETTEVKQLPVSIAQDKVAALDIEIAKLQVVRAKYAEMLTEAGEPIEKPEPEPEPEPLPDEPVAEK